MYEKFSQKKSYAVWFSECMQQDLCVDKLQSYSYTCQREIAHSRVWNLFLISPSDLVLLLVSA